MLLQTKVVGTGSCKTKLEGLRGWSWRNHKGETRLGGEVNPSSRGIQAFVPTQPSACLFPAPHPFFFIQQRLSAHLVLGNFWDTEMDLSSRTKEATGPKRAVI